MLPLLGQAVVLVTGTSRLSLVDDPLHRAVLSTAMIAAGLPVLPRAVSLMREAWSQLQSSNGTTQGIRRQTEDSLVQEGPEEADEGSSIHATLLQAVERAHYSLGPSPESPGDVGRSLLPLSEDFVQLLESLADGLRRLLAASGAEASQRRGD